MLAITQTERRSQIASTRSSGVAMERVMLEGEKKGEYILLSCFEELTRQPMTDDYLSLVQKKTMSDPYRIGLALPSPSPTALSSRPCRCRWRCRCRCEQGTLVCLQGAFRGQDSCEVLQMVVACRKLWGIETGLAGWQAPIRKGRRGMVSTCTSSLAWQRK